jgi:mannose-6-phosphate isomerase-like protein (cupin superfamily)
VPSVTDTAQVVSAAPVASHAAAADALTARPTIGPHTNFHPLEQALLECAAGRSRPRSTDQAEEVLFVLEGAGTLHVAGEEHALEAESGAYVGPGVEYELHNPGPHTLRIVSVRVPDPEPPASPDAPRVVVRRLADQAAQEATTQREFRIVADPGSGLRSATHFVGYIPTARAPEHFHTYHEVIHVIEGEGAFHAEGMTEPVGPGSCIQLPARTVHCLENTGGGLMRVVAVFRPAGSPADAYYPDGTPAYAGAEEHPPEEEDE